MAEPDEAAYVEALGRESDDRPEAVDTTTGETAAAMAELNTDRIRAGVVAVLVTGVRVG